MLPEGWKSTSVSDACETVSVGIVVNPSHYYVEEDLGVRAFRSQNVRENQVNENNWVYISSDGHRKNAKSTLRAGDVVVVRTGFAGVSCVVPPHLDGVNCIDILFARPKSNMLIPQYLCELTNSEVGKRQVFNGQSGLAQKHLNVSTYEKMRFPLPPLNEQQRIADVLATWNAAIATTEKLLANSRSKKEAMASKLLRARPNWVTKSFSELFNIRNRKEAQIPATDYPSQGSLPIVDQGQQRIAAYTDDESVWVDPPMVVFGDHTRAVKWIDFRFRPGADGTQLLSPAPTVHPKFAYHLLANAPVPNLGYSRHMSHVKQLKFSLPPERIEQARISEQLDLADQVIASAMTQIECLKLEKRALMADLLTGKRRVRLPSSSTEPEAA